MNTDRERYLKAEAEIERLRKALARYVSCRHGSIDCNCTLEARAALYTPEATR